VGFHDADERATMELAEQLLASGSFQPLIARLRAREVGREQVRGALRILVEFDSELLVRITLEGLISACLEES
jgi:hypothetical protein